MKLALLTKSVGRENRGFSLLEILIVLAILAIIATLLMTGIRNYAARQAFTTTVVTVTDSIVAARANTIASLNDTNYGVHASSTAVVIFTGDTFIEGAAGNNTILFPPNITATTTFTNNVTTATFTRLTGLPSAVGTIVLFDSRTESTATITLTTTGLVE